MTARTSAPKIPKYQREVHRAALELGYELTRWKTHYVYRHTVTGVVVTAGSTSKPKHGEGWNVKRNISKLRRGARTAG